MKKLSVFLATSVIMFFMSENLYPQGTFFLHAGPSFPTSDFGDDDSGGAGVGLNLGGKYTYRLNYNGLGLYIGADFIYNGLKGSVKDEIEDRYSEYGDIDIKYIKYINVPIIAGINYKYTLEANDDVSLFADLGLGCDFLKETNLSVKADNEEMELLFKLSTQLAYKIGGGLLIQNRYIIGLHYNGLGKHKIKCEGRYGDETWDEGVVKQEVDILTLTLGISF